MRPPRRGDPTIEFHEQDNLALESIPLHPPSDFIYDNSCYNNMRQATVFPGALRQYVIRHSCQA